MNKEQLIEELGKIDQYIWHESPRVPGMEWDAFTENIFEAFGGNCWEDLGLQELEEAYERGSFIMHSVIKGKYPED